MRVLWLGLFATMFVAACSQSGPAQPSAFALTDDQVRAILADRVDYYQTAPGIVVGMIGPGERRIVAYGLMRMGEAAPVDGDTLFDIASSTKAFTALLLAEMVQRGEVKLDDPVAMYLDPNMRIPVQADGRTITLLDLATFTSGLPHDPPNLAPVDPLNPFIDYTLEMQAAFLGTFEPAEPIGSRVSYSNTGFNLLGQALSRRAGKTFDVLLKERVLDPLGMSDTLVINGQEPPQRFAGRLATGRGRDFHSVPHVDHPPDFYGSGALTSTANDLLDLLEAMAGLKETELKPAIESMLDVRRATWLPETLVGLSWGVTQTNDREIVWRPGGHAGFESWIGYNPVAKTGVVVLANAGGENSDIGMHLLDPRTPLSAHTKVMTLSAARLDSFAGRYRLPDGQYVTIVRDGDQLKWNLDGFPPVSAVAYGDRNFLTPAFDGRFTFDFDREDQARPSRAVFYQAGQVEVADRVE